MLAVPTAAEARPQAAGRREAGAELRTPAPGATDLAAETDAIWALVDDGLQARHVTARLAQLDARICYRLLARPRLVAEVKGREIWRTPLMVAIERGHVAVARALLRGSALASRVGVREEDGSPTTAMTLAARSGQPKMLDLLAEADGDDSDALFVLARQAQPKTIAWLRERHQDPHLFDGVLADACREGGGRARALIDACTRHGGVTLENVPKLMVTALVNGHFSLATRLLDLGAAGHAIHMVDMDVWSPASDEACAACPTAWPADPQPVRRPVTVLGLVLAAGCERARERFYGPAPSASPYGDRQLCLPRGQRLLREEEVAPRLHLIRRLAGGVGLAPPSHSHAWVLATLVAAGDTAAYALVARHLSAWPTSVALARALLADVPVVARPDLACLVERQAAALAQNERPRARGGSWASWLEAWFKAPPAASQASARARQQVAEMVGIIEAGGSDLPGEVAARVWVGRASSSPRAP